MPDRSAVERREKVTMLKEARAFLRELLAIFHGTFTDIMWNAGYPGDKSFCNNLHISRRQNHSVEAAAVADIYPPNSKDELNA